MYDLWRILYRILTIYNTRPLVIKGLQYCMEYDMISTRDNNSLAGAIPAQRPKGGKA